MKIRLMARSKDNDLVMEKGMHERMDALESVIVDLKGLVEDLKIKRKSDPTIKDKVKGWFGK